MKENKDKIRFRDLPVNTWFRANGALHQKLPNLNGANCYKWQRGMFYVEPMREVVPVAQPQLKDQPRQKKPHVIGLLFSDMTLQIGPQKNK